MPEELESLCQQLAGFEISLCDMVHERIRRIPGSEQPVLSSLTEHGYKRVEYCSSDIRTPRLGCAHTMARFRLGDILDAVCGTYVDAEQIRQWKTRLKKIDDSIICVDRQKSDAELAHAQRCVACHQSPDDKSLREQLENQAGHIRTLVEAHRQCVKQVEDLRDEVLSVLRSAADGRNSTT